MQFELPLSPSDGRRAGETWLHVGARLVRLHLVANRRARRYVLRLNRDGTARVTVPRGGTAIEARLFAEKNSRWLERQFLRQASLKPRTWKLGTSVLFHGEAVPLEPVLNGDSTRLRLGSELLSVKDTAVDLRPEVERYLMRLACKELSERTLELAALHGIRIRRISVRNQRSRWGSCSRRGTISLNWRLIQTPPFVRDYILLHELAHVREMNHSSRFWQEVARLCPDYRGAERWLKKHSELLL